MRLVPELLKNNQWYFLRLSVIKNKSTTRQLQSISWINTSLQFMHAGPDILSTYFLQHLTYLKTAGVQSLLLLYGVFQNNMKYVSISESKFQSLLLPDVIFIENWRKI